MEQKNRHERLELNQDLKVTRATWKVERLGWIGLGAALAAALLGLLGPGPLSEASTGPGAILVRYQRFAHFEAEAELDVEVRPTAPGAEMGIWLSSEYLRDMEIRGVTPPPARTRVERDRAVYFYEVAGDGPLTIRFDIVYRKIGRLKGTAGILGGAEAEFAHWIYP